MMEGTLCSEYAMQSFKLVYLVFLVGFQILELHHMMDECKL